MLRIFSLALLLFAVASPAYAQGEPPVIADEDDDDELHFGASTAAPPAPASGEPDGAPADEDDHEYGASATVRTPTAPEDSLGRSRVTRTQLDERQPRSTPEALRYEPGVSVQQSAHGQASPYLRGMTGQQVVHLFDGVRLNNGIYRQGPNQYFFTVDSRTVDHLDVIRGSASTRYGSDALGGAILAAPISPFIDPEGEGWHFFPRVTGRYGSADRELGGRLELEVGIEDHTAVLVGGGYRDVGRLESGGVVDHPNRSAACDDPSLPAPRRGECAPWSPRFAEEADHPDPRDRKHWRTQLGTGFREGTFDARVVHALTPRLDLVAATYGYRQYDAPRTDQCPPPEAPNSECLSIEEQFRTLTYLRLAGPGGGAMRDVSLVLSHQRHHEERVRDRPRSSVRFDYRDDVDTLGLAFQAATPAVSLGERARLVVRYGLDGYRDDVSSRASQSLTDIGFTQDLTRGQYLDGSLYLSSGLFAEAELIMNDWLVVRGGGRGALVSARAPADPESGTERVRENFAALVGRVGVELRPSAQTSVHVNVDQGFRAPNLDDLTSRQQVGPGFQFENAGLGPERTLTFEAGVASDVEWLTFELWGFATLLDEAITRSVRTSDDCPPGTPQCSASRNQLQLVNATERSFLVGAEGGATAYLPRDVALRTTVSYVFGEGPDLSSSDASGRVPLSRVPPPGGTFEARWRHVATGFYAAAALRWAARQDRLAPVDESDARIPDGGTPGYGVVDLRAGYRWGHRLMVNAIFENVFDAAWRTHGSSINGPGRSVVLAVSAGL